MKRNKVTAFLLIFLLTLIGVIFTVYTFWVSYSWINTTFNHEPHEWVIVGSLVFLILCIFREILLCRKQLLKQNIKNGDSDK